MHVELTDSHVDRKVGKQLHSIQFDCGRRCCRVDRQVDAGAHRVSCGNARNIPDSSALQTATSGYVAEYS